MIRRLFILTLVSLAGTLAAQAQEVRPGPGSNPLPKVPVLTVSGNGETRVAPDEVTVRLGVLAQEPTARAAQEQVNRIANAILDAVRKLGVPAEQIQTEDLNLNPVYAQNRPGQEGEPRIAGYQANNVVSVRLTKLDQAGPVIDAGLAAGANRLDGVAFGLRDDRAARAQALTAAVAEAQGKAQALARALKVRLIRILEVAEAGLQVQPPIYRGKAMMAEAMATAPTPVSPGQVGVTAAVTVTWEIAPE